MYKIKNLISLILVFAICLSLAIPIGASELTDANGTAQTPVVLNVEAATFKVTVPTSLPVSVLADGSVQVAEKATITNLSAGAVKVTNVAIEAANSWELVNYQIDLDEFKVNDKKIGLQLNSADEMTNADSVFTFDATKWTRLDATGGTNDKYDFTYNAVVAPQSDAIDGATVANVVFTIEWDKAEIEYTPFTITADNRSMIGYTGAENEELVIPATFVGDDGVNYTVVGIGNEAFRFCESLTNITIPNSVTSIGTTAFEDTGLTGELVIPDSVTSIGTSAFMNCTNLTTITIPNSVTTIANWAFAGCTNLTSVTIPNSITTIERSVFKGCTNLTSVTIPDSVTTIGKEAFYRCNNLTNVTIPASVTSIGDYSFAECYNLTNVTIPKDVTTIGDYAFMSCNNLISVTISEAVTNIGTMAFYNCVDLTDVYYTCTEDQWNAIEISSGNTDLTNATIHYNYVPE